MNTNEMLREIFFIKHSYEELRQQWEEFCSLIKDNLDSQKPDYSDTSFPQFLKDTSDDYRMYCYFTEQPLFFEFKQYKEYLGCIVFGYQNKNFERIYQDYTSTFILFDRFGNVKYKEDKPQVMGNITTKDSFTNVLIPCLYQALNDAIHNNSK